MGLSSRCNPFHELLLQHSINRPHFENGVLVCWLDFVTGNADPKPSKNFMAPSYTDADSIAIVHACDQVSGVVTSRQHLPAALWYRIFFHSPRTPFGSQTLNEFKRQRIPNHEGRSARDGFLLSEALH